MISAIIGFLSTLFDVFSIGHSLTTWWSGKKELKRSTDLLKVTGYFIAHIIHIGGEFSRIHSLHVFCNEEGGYYLNPAARFVDIGFNRGGDSMVVMPSPLSRKLGFVVDAIAAPHADYVKVVDPDICHMPISSMKNECFVKFVKRSN